MDTLHPSVRGNPCVFQREQGRRKSLIEQRVWGLDPVGQQFVVVSFDVGQRFVRIHLREFEDSIRIFGKRKQKLSRSFG